MRSLVLMLLSIVILVVVSTVVAEEEMTDEEMKALLKAYENIRNGRGRSKDIWKCRGKRC